MKKQLWMLVSGAMLAGGSAANAADNVVLFIGHGMGANHIKAARAYVNGNTGAPLSFESPANINVPNAYTAWVNTALPDGTATDSAAAGTAMATGYQHPGKAVVSMGANNAIKSHLLDFANAKGRRAGLITSGSISGPTISAFGAHEPDCTYDKSIRGDYFRADSSQNHASSLPYVLMGGGYDDPESVPGASSSLVNLAKSLSYKVSYNATDLVTINSATTGRLLGLYGSTWEPMTPMAYRTDASQPTLTEMIKQALLDLEGNGGFLLIIESANIDVLSRNKDANFVAEIAELNSAYEAVQAWSDEHQWLDNTFIFVTSDHETGSLTVDDQVVTPGQLPAIKFNSASPTTAPVPLFANWGEYINGQTIDNTDIYSLVKDAMYASKGGVPPVISSLAAAGTTETSTSIQWNADEASWGEVSLTANGSTLIFASAEFGNSHSVLCEGLQPGTAYTVVVEATDLAGAIGRATNSFMTAGGDVNARVVGEPAITVGTVSGTYLGVITLGDNVKQSFTEATEGAGSGLTVDYTLQTSLAPSAIDALTIQGSYTWTLKETTDPMKVYIRLLGPQGSVSWQQISFPFNASPAYNYVDASGKIVVRFDDAAAIKRENKDTLAVDYLYGAIVKNANTVTPPTAATKLAAAINNSTVALSWADASNEDGYQIWRYSTATGWKALGTAAANATSYSDATVASSTAYTYVVRAFNADAYADSDSVSITIPLILSAPGSFKASPVRGAINLSWTDTNTAETGYEILKSSTGLDGSWSVIVTTAANAVSYADKAITSRTVYYYKARPVVKSTTTITGPECAPVSATAK